MLHEEADELLVGDSDAVMAVVAVLAEVARTLEQLEVHLELDAGLVVVADVVAVGERAIEEADVAAVRDIGVAMVAGAAKVNEEAADVAAGAMAAGDSRGPSQRRRSPSVDTPLTSLFVNFYSPLTIIFFFYFTLSRPTLRYERACN